MTLRTKGAGEAPDAELFLRFSRSFPPSAAWRPYFVRWERHARLGRHWLVRVWIEVPGKGRATARVFLASASRRGIHSEGERAFERLRDDLEGLGYEVLPPGSFGRFVKWFRPTRSLLVTARREIESLFWPEQRRLRTTGPARGGVPGALLHFVRATTWAPSACGWEWRFELWDGTETQLVMIVHPCGEGGRLAPQPEVLIYPPLSTSRPRLRQLTALCRAAGYDGGFETARPRGREPFLVGNFQKDPLSFEATAAERAHLDELAAAIRRLR